MSRIHYIILGMRYRIVLLGEAQHFENGEVHYRTIAEIEIGRIAPPPRRPRNAGGTAAPAAAAPSSGWPSSPPVTACPGQSPQEEEEEKGAPLQAAGNYPRSSQGYDTTPIAGHPPRATT